MLRIILPLFLLLVSILPTTPQAAERAFNPILIMQTPVSDGDRAFHDSASKGLLRASREFNIKQQERRFPVDADMTAEIRALAQEGYSPIIALGFQNVMPVQNLAEEFPDTHFTVVDGLVPPLFPNVQSILFKDHEGAFLVGMIAAFTTKTNHIGFIGGMDIPLMRNFNQGFQQGARYVKPAIKVTSNMVGTTYASWSDPQKARALAQQQYSEGVDVIFAAAGLSGLGVLEEAAASKRYAIGVDINQNGLFPGFVLTSLVKRVDIAIYETLSAEYQGKWGPGIKSLGIKEGALDFAVDMNNRHLITEQMIEQVTSAKERIINGIIDVEPYSPR